MTTSNKQHAFVRRSAGAVYAGCVIALACSSDPIGAGPNPLDGTPGAPGGAGLPMGASGAALDGSGAGAGALGAPTGAPTGSGGAGAMGEPVVGGNSAVGEPPALGPRPGLAARISKAEYTNSVLDALGVELTALELDASSGGIPDDAGDGVFKHFADKQTTIEQHALAYFETADAVASRLDVASLSTQYAFCQDATAACGAEMIASVGRRLFRRSLDDREKAALQVLFDDALTEETQFAPAAGWTIAAMLQAPQFLFRMENETVGTVGQDRALDGIELAARLASFLWVSVPDDALLVAAEAGELADPAAVRVHVTRMLADARAQRFTETFIRDFSRAHLASFEGATEEDRAALSESVVATFQNHLWDAQRSIAELFTTTEYVVNERVAELLDVDFSGAGTQTIDVSTLPERVGLMTHPGVIAGMGDRGVGSFVNRGKYLMEHLLCRNPIAVPAALLGELDQFNADTTGLNEHERAAIRMTRPECWACHAQFEPFAFGFSRFDGSGRYVGEQDEQGRPLPLDGWVPVSSQEESPKYTNVAEYMAILAADTTVQTCMTEHFLSFATARGTDASSRAEATQVGATYVAGGATLAAMVNAVTSSDIFGRIRTIAPSSASAGGSL